jgi:hypothetical protein
MPKSLTTLDSHTADVVETRRKTQEARFKPVPIGAERVDDVLRQAVDYLSSHLAPLGFKAAPSKLAFSRKSGDVTHVIALQADASNLSGVSVEVSADARVKSASHKRWTGEHGTKYSREYLWIQQLGYLSGGHDYYKWQLVDPTQREKELADLLSRIRTLALPVFQEWIDKGNICRALMRRTEVDRIDWLMETALWCGNSDVAKLLAEQHLRIRPQDMPVFVSELACFRADPTIGEPKHSPASGAAYLAARYGLDVDV